MRIGIDPGVTGAIAVLDDELNLLAVFDMPVMLSGKTQQVNAAALAKNLVSYQSYQVITELKNHAPIRIFLEQVNAMPGQGVTSMFNFGTSYGIIIGVCSALAYPLFLVRPNLWKKRAGLLNKPKDAARGLAQQVYPETDLSLKKHIGRADAILIARFGEE